MSWLATIRAYWVRIILAGLFVLACLYYVAPRMSAFSVSATTEYLRVTVSDDNQRIWYLPRIETCLEDTSGTPDPASPCASGFSMQTLTDVEVEFSTGYDLTFRGFRPNQIELAIGKRDNLATVLFYGIGTDEGGITYERTVPVTDAMSVIIHFDESDQPYIEMRGLADLGERPEQSSGLILRSATYEIRQALAGRSPLVVGRGTALQGDKMNFILNEDAGLFNPPPKAESSKRGRGAATLDATGQRRQWQEVPATVFVTDISRSAAFAVILTTPLEYSSIGITRIGSVISTVPVSWTARLSNDPLPAAIGTLFGLLGALLALSNAYLAPPRKKPADTLVDQKEE